MKYPEDYLNKIINMDCLEAMKQMPDKCVDLVLTDPPYGIDYNPNWKTWSGEKQNKEKVIGDKEKFNPKFLLDKFENIILFGANYYSDLLPIGDWIIWDKRTNEKNDKMFGQPIEMAWYRSNKMKGLKIYRVLHGGVVNADSTYGNNEPRFHPTQKPVKLFAKILLDFSKEGDTILDPFLGSGTTAVAAKLGKRNFIGIEISKDYCAIAEERLRAISNPLF